VQSHELIIFFQLNQKYLMQNICGGVVQNSILLPYQKELDKLIHWFKKYLSFSAASLPRPKQKVRKRNDAMTISATENRFTDSQQKIAYVHHFTERLH
jgi:hypothetical protein